MGNSEHLSSDYKRNLQWPSQFVISHITVWVIKLKGYCNMHNGQKKHA